MINNTEIFLICLGSFIFILLFVFCIKFYKDINTKLKEKNVANKRKKIILKRVKPIICISDEEVKDEFENNQIRIEELT